MKIKTGFVTLTISMVMVCQAVVTQAADAGQPVWSERAANQNSVFIWLPENLEAVTGWNTSQIVSSPLKGKIQVQAKGVCGVAYETLYLYRAGKCIVSASLRTSGSKKTKYASKTYLVIPSSIPALVANMPPLVNGVLLTKDPGLFMPPDANGQRRYVGTTFPAGPSWGDSAQGKELGYAYASYWSCRAEPSDCDIMPLIQYFESQGWSVTAKPRSTDKSKEFLKWKWKVESFNVSMRKGNATIYFSSEDKTAEDDLVLNDGQTAVRLQIGMPTCRPSAIAANKKYGINSCAAFYDMD